MAAASRPASGFAPSSGMASELTAPDDTAIWSVHLLIGIIDHAHNGALDLLQRAAAERAQPTGSSCLTEPVADNSCRGKVT